MGNKKKAEVVERYSFPSVGLTVVILEREVKGKQEFTVWEEAEPGWIGELAKEPEASYETVGGARLGVLTYLEEKLK